MVKHCLNKKILIVLLFCIACISDKAPVKSVENRFTYSNKYVKISTGTEGNSAEIKYRDRYNGNYVSKYENYKLRSPEKVSFSEAYEDKTLYKKPSKYKGYYKVGNPYTIMGQTYYPKEEPNYKEVGMASWYGAEFDGKQTANGEIYDMHDYTAAHRTLPLPSIVKVTNLENGKSAVVRVNDRGPFVKNRIIDVSKNVAKKLDFHEKGTTKVRVEFLQKETNKMLKEFGLK